MDSTLAAANFARWQSALSSREPENIVALYAEKMTLLPTMARQTVTDHAGARRYFTFFCSLQPTVRIVEEYVIVIANERYAHCGVYRFALMKEGTREDVDARFTMLWSKIDGVWKILHHHSSIVPA